jgi:NADH-quinone oxidoreductase subunit G
MIGPEGAEGWCGFNVLHDAAGRVGALDIGFLPGEGGRDAAAILDGASKGEIELAWLLGADEIDTSKLGKAFVIYQGSHGDAGAHRADVILPAAAYTEEDGTFVNLEGRVQQTKRCVFPPGEAKENWRIVRAVSGALGKPLPYDDLPALRTAIAVAVPHLGTLDTPAASPGADAALWEGVGESGEIGAAPAAYRISDFYLTNPIARASRTMAECSKLYVKRPLAVAAE